MKTPRAFQSRRGFTLIELLVAMTITTIIVGVLVSITSIAIDTWNRSRSELRAARQAKTMIDMMARDFESLVVRRGNVNEWLIVQANKPTTSTNAAKIIFFTAATDRYAGEIGTSADQGGDVSCVGYQLDWKDPISTGGDFKTYVLNRMLIDPMIKKYKNESNPPLLRGAFDLLGFKENPNVLTPLEESFDKLNEKLKADSQDHLDSENNFVCENVFQFTVTFHIEAPPVTTGGVATNELVTIMPTGGTTEFRIKGTGIETIPVNDKLKTGRLTAVEISLTVLSDGAVNLLRKTPAKADDAAWLAKNSFQYSKLIQLPGM